MTIANLLAFKSHIIVEIRKVLESWNLYITLQLPSEVNFVFGTKNLVFGNFSSCERR